MMRSANPRGVFGGSRQVEANMLSAQGWSETGPRMFAAEIAGSDRAVIRMTVESMAGRRWEWIVWERGKGAGTRHGTARSAQEAMRAAEAEAAKLADAASESGPVVPVST